MKVLPKLTATALVGAVLLIASACGGGGSTSSTSASTKSSASSASGAASSTSKAAPVKITVGYPETVATFTPVFAAAAQGYFAKNGLDVKLALVHGPQEVAALSSNSLQFALGGAPTVIAADLGGDSVVMLAALSPYPIYHLDVAPSIKKPSDLAGKTIGVPVVGGVGYAFLRFYLAKNNLLGKVKITALGSEPALLAGLKKGLVVGGMFNPPATTEAEKAGFPALMNSLKLGVPFANSTVDVTRSYLKSHRQVVTEFLKAYMQGWKFIANPANKAAVVSILQKYTHASAALAQVAYASTQPVWAGTSVPIVDPNGVKNVLPYVKNPGAKSAQPNSFIDNSILQSVAGS